MPAMMAAHDIRRQDPFSLLFDEPRSTSVQSRRSGRFTRFGDVTELISDNDDRLVVMGAGDELTVRFRVPAGVLPSGWKRGFLLYSVGWDKDCNLNTVPGHSSEPFPFREMTAYPFAPEETSPNTVRHRAYLRRYQTRHQDQTTFWRAD